MPVSQETSVCLLALSSPHVIVGTHVSNLVAPLGLENCSGLAYVAWPCHTTESLHLALSQDLRK